MDSTPNNPASNQIGQGVSDAQILTAVERSGYPLQTTVAEILRPNFERIQQEWCYLDKDTNDLRSIDIWAEQSLHDWDPQPRVRPTINLLIECKQSELPYIFFPSSTPLHPPQFPVIAGLRSDAVEITTDDDPSTWTLYIPVALDLSADAFQAEPRHCSTLSKCVRKGSDLELSGVDAYSHLVLPLTKALQHFEIAQQPPETAWYFDAHLVLALGVLDAPMIVATANNNRTTLTLLPWVRVFRHEYLERAEEWERDRLWAIDIVHKSFLPEFLTDHLLPFARRFSERTLQHQTELATGKGFAPGMGEDSWNNIEGRLRVRPVTARFNRARIAANNLLRFLLRRLDKD